MMQLFFTLLVYSLFVYLAIGFFFALAFVIKGASKIDPVAAKGTRGFRALIFPGAMALWPILLLKWLRS